ncbi:cysteine hydrolase family protein [Vagococcus luciliae]|uniref:Peroxyureidoacrylate/ureidoacrylate amidohydrolase RutB n=1 Tax=Vagococcus luciliae TaxID=2920380 RepID=A0ABY5P1D6_9ENTE|nr:isochorismatase family cysteine hydrolase [Vagococcus luciliae]UUV99739.1 Peroxyureidoacrylate/ureidoacrylate amidohydrolase RutB [Vagococcus luciliae]
MGALISIDYTNDFVASDGKLTTGEFGQAIETEMVRLTNQFIDDGNYIVFAIDCHDDTDKYHPENNLFPPHNIFGTKGRELYQGLNDVYQQNKGKDTVYWIDKRHYSAFSGTDLDIRLRERKIDTLHLVGVCTDICVLHTAIDAYNLGYNIVIHEKAVQSFDQVGHKWALGHFKNTLGATII